MNKIIILALVFSIKNVNAENLNNLTFQDFYGQDVKLEDYNISYRNGMLVNIWATWCTPCVKELPSLMRLQKKMPGLTVVAISVDRNKKIVKSFLKRKRFNQNTLVYLFDKNGKQFKSVDISKVPTSILFNNKGEIVDIIYGERNWSGDIMINQIQEKLKKFY